MSYIFGPVPSRRLGLSLGVDLIPHKTCTFDCLYCEVGKTTLKTITPEIYAPVDLLLSELKERLLQCDPEVITLAGSGEPTLHAEIDYIISEIRNISDKKIVILTNGSLFWDKDVRERVLGADLIMPTLSSVFETTFKAIHRPHGGLKLAEIVEGLKALRKEFEGLIYLEVILLKGMNDTEREVSALKSVIQEIQPDRIQLNTVVRPPTDSRAKALDTRRLEEIKLFLGDRAEIVADVDRANKALERDSKNRVLLDMVKRRPLRSKDIANAMGLTPAEAEGILKGLLLKGYLNQYLHGEEKFYIPGDRDAL